jgi:phosphohistidine phosphatase
MELILWRHAEAHDGVPDAQRALSPKGEKQAKKMAKWLAARLPGDARIIASPTTRTRQTAQALGRPFETLAAIGTAAMPGDILASAGWPDSGKTVVVVGHQPTLGRVAALLLSGTAADWSVKKGAVWWFETRGRGEAAEVTLRAALGVDSI